ncbi:hypothetical protein [Aliikangiella coralliicola]|uniref:Uncharacterized protein n=1 Tax=Aliikangiella coralliicola TaxID=2592383 RepID=A0A545UIN2_9GAMM|nr:hypothetical protein [Aliikangiella coralliicola]TQV89320.1 hypothetical protein FLL46_00095 [Aliikangiella coralliicola]
MKKLLLLILMFPMITDAANFSCKGKVSVLAIGPTSGILQVNAGYGVHYLCKLHEEMNGVHPEICKAWYSMFLTAKASGKQMSQSYSQIPGGPQDCASLGSWVTTTTPYFVQIVD